MAREGSVKYLNTAKSGKNDEFYTILSDIEKELRHYTGHFRNKAVLCNCDDPRVSNFFKYFLNNFQKLGLKELIATCYQNDKPDLFSQHKSDKGIYFRYRGEQKDEHLLMCRGYLALLPKKSMPSPVNMNRLILMAVSTWRHITTTGYCPMAPQLSSMAPVPRAQWVIFQPYQTQCPPSPYRCHSALITCNASGDTLPDGGMKQS